MTAVRPASPCTVAAASRARLGRPAQRIRHADNECNYCAECQCGGKLLVDRGPSALLEKHWPKTLAELEERRGTG